MANVSEQIKMDDDGTEASDGNHSIEGQPTVTLNSYEGTLIYLIDDWFIIDEDSEWLRAWLYGLEASNLSFAIVIRVIIGSIALFKFLVT